MARSRARNVRATQNAGKHTVCQVLQGEGEHAAGVEFVWRREVGGRAPTHGESQRCTAPRRSVSTVESSHRYQQLPCPSHRHLHYVCAGGSAALTAASTIPPCLGQRPPQRPTLARPGLLVPVTLPKSAQCGRRSGSRWRTGLDAGALHPALAGAGGTRHHLDGARAGAVDAADAALVAHRRGTGHGAAVRAQPRLGVAGDHAGRTKGPDLAQHPGDTRGYRLRFRVGYAGPRGHQLSRGAQRRSSAGDHGRRPVVFGETGRLRRRQGYRGVAHRGAARPTAPHRGRHLVQRESGPACLCHRQPVRSERDAHAGHREWAGARDPVAERPPHQQRATDR
eukprot:ctg_93.g12